MAWLTLGALLLLLAIPGGHGKAGRRLDPLGLAAIAGFAAAAWWGLSVYGLAKVAPIALAWAAALVPALLLGPRHALPRSARRATLALGVASSLFALFGPPDGLF